MVAANPPQGYECLVIFIPGKVSLNIIIIFHIPKRGAKLYVYEAQSWSAHKYP